MNHGSLFSGGGGFDIAAENVGWQNIFHCEWNPFCQKILKHYWPQATSYKDIKEFNATQYKGKIDIITGGFPCQPFSHAGKRKGTEDNRYLWPEMLRIIREVQPKWVIGENVFGLVSWSGGMVFDKVQSDLEREGYEVQPFVLPACAVNAPHRRDRVWFVAHSLNEKQPQQDIYSSRKKEGLQDWRDVFAECNGYGRKGTITLSKRFFNTGFKDFPSFDPICSGNDGLPAKLDGITFPKWRAETMRLYGNAIVPQVAMQIFKVINLIEQWKRA